MNTQLFQSLDKLMTEGMVMNITVQKSGDKLICSILPKFPDVKDEGIIKAISEPISRANGLLTNLRDFEESTSAAEKNNKKVEADKKKFDQLIKKADQLEKDKKHLNAVACLKQALEFTTNKKQIEDRIKKIEASANQNTIFGDMDTEDPVQENYLDGEEEPIDEDDNNDNEEEEE